jgi:hypothetical protein
MKTELVVSPLGHRGEGRSRDVEQSQSLLPKLRTPWSIAMARIAIVVGCLLSAILLVSVQARPRELAADAPKGEEKPPDQTTSEKLHEVLESPESVYPELPADPQTHLGLVLNSLSQKYSRLGDNPPFSLKFEIDVQAFKAEGIEDVAGFQVVKEIPLPKVINTTPRRFIALVLARVNVPSGAAIIVRDSFVEITTNKAVRKRIWGNHPGPFLPLVHVRFEKKPLADALKVLAKQSEYNVLLDGKVGEKARTPITSEFSNLPLDSAVALLADMADLTTILQDNAIYVTMRRSAAQLKSELKPNNPTDRIGPGLRGVPVPPAQAVELE